MRAKKHAKEFASAKARKLRLALYSQIRRKRKNRAVQQMLQLHVRFGEHVGWLSHLKKLV